MKIYCKLVTVISLLLLTACSSKDLYQTGQDYQKSKCIKEAVTDIQYSECLKQSRKSYEDYQRERKEVVDR